jgi:hypothetical protein
MTEAQKKEMALSTNVFNKPLERVQKTAWTTLILRLMTMRRGSDPSAPDKGIGITSHSYETIDTIAGSLKSKIESQVKTYLPDIPLKSIYIKSFTTKTGQLVAVYIMEFFNSDETTDTVVVASNKVNNFINFEIAM